MEMEQKINKLIGDNTKKENKDKYDTLKHKYDEMMTELKEIENDMKFYKKVCEDSV